MSFDNRSINGAFNRAGFRHDAEQLDLAKSSLGMHYVLAKGATIVPWTGSLVETALVPLVLPGGLLGPTGWLRWSILWSCTNNANTKTLKVRLAGTTLAQQAVTTQAAARMSGWLANRNSESVQAFGQATTGLATDEGTSTGSITQTAIDTTVNQTLDLAGLLANVGDTLSIEAYLIEVFPSL